MSETYILPQVAEEVAQAISNGLKAVTHGKQELTEKKKAQARDNIGAASEDDVLYGTESYTEIQDITDTLTLTDKALRASGGVAPNQGHSTEPFDVQEGERYFVKGTYGYGYCLVAEYDSAGNFVGYEGNVEGQTIYAHTYDHYEYIVPSGVAKIAVSSNESVSKPTTIVVKKEVAVTVPVSVKEKVKEHEKGVEKIDKVYCDVGGKVDKSFVYDYDSTIAIIIELLKKGTYSEDVTAKIEAIENSVYPNAIKLSNTLATGTYKLKYEDASGAMADWLDICTFTISSAGQLIAYTGFIEENVAPKTATKIGVYNADNTRVGEIALGWLNRFFSGWTPTYTFAAVSDTHVGEDGADADFTDAVEYFEDTVDFAVVCGDCVDDATDTTQLETYHGIVENVQTPIYVITGNHEAVNMDTSGANADISGNYASISQYFAQTAHPNINQELYYSFEKNGDVFIMVGAYGNYNYGYDRTFSAEELQWLYETLETNRNKRCFLFHHYFPKNGSGDAINCYATNDGLRGTQGEVFYSLLRHYKNVIYFHGHSHEKFNAQELNRYNTIDKEYGMYSVHIPSLTKPKDPNATQNSLLPDWEAGEGYIVDVYSTAVHLKGRDFESGKYTPVGSYWLLTTLKEIDAGTFYDPTGTIDT